MNVLEQRELLRYTSTGSDCGRIVVLWQEGFPVDLREMQGRADCYLCCGRRGFPSTSRKRRAVDVATCSAAHSWQREAKPWPRAGAQLESKASTAEPDATGPSTLHAHAPLRPSPASGAPHARGARIWCGWARAAPAAPCGPRPARPSRQRSPQTAGGAGWGPGLAGAPAREGGRVECTVSKVGLRVERSSLLIGNSGKSAIRTATHHGSMACCELMAAAGTLSALFSHACKQGRRTVHHNYKGSASSPRRTA